MNTKTIISSSKVLLLIAGLLISSSSFAAIVSGNVTSAGGSFMLIAPPTIVGNNNHQQDDLFAFNEKQAYTLTSDLAVDLGGTAGVIASGTTISSHYVFFDPKKSLRQIASVLFDADVLGIITSKMNLDNSDILGDAFTTTYLSPNLRGLESRDSALIDMINSQQINLDWRASSPGDYIRVITAAAPVPLPAAFWLFGSAILATVGWSRKKVAV